MKMQDKRFVPHPLGTRVSAAERDGEKRGFQASADETSGVRVITMQKNNDGWGKFVARCSELLKYCNRSTQKMLDYAVGGELERCDWESQNRDRLIKIINQEYLEMKKKFAEKIDSNPDFFESWENEFHFFVQKNLQRDAEILDILKGARSELQKAIASVYKIRKNIQGYNPHNV